MANEAFNEGNELFVAEEYEEAEKAYSRAIELDAKVARYYLNRAANRLKMENYVGTISDLLQAINMEPNNKLAQYRLGVAYFHMNEFESARKRFEKAQHLGHKRCDLWIRKCDAEIRHEAKTLHPGGKAGGSAAQVSPSPAVTSASTASPMSTPAPSSSSSSSSSSSAPAAAVPAPVKKRIREDWAQTHAKVMITLYVKGLTADDVAVTIEKQRVTAEVKLPGGGVHTREWALASSVAEEKSTYTVTKYKIEILLIKDPAGIEWPTLEAAADVSKPVRKLPDASSASGVAYPYAHKKKLDWDALDREQQKDEEEEEVTGDAALNKLFQKIYKNANPDVRRAMMKSYQTSGGTVLSTNWDEVSKTDYEKNITPPKGQEVRKFEV